MKKVLCLLLTFVLLIGMTACKKTLSEEEAKELEDKGWEYYNTARFAEAIDTWQELYDGSGCDEKFFNDKKNDAEANSILCQYISLAISELRGKLKDPSSLIIYDATITNSNDENYSFTIQFDYGAKNSFGGMVRNTFTSRKYSLSDADKEVVYQQSKRMLRKDLPEETYRGFWGAPFITDRYVTAILEGTITYYNGK